MAVNNVPAGQVGSVVQGFVDNGSRTVVAEREGNGITYTVGEPAAARELRGPRKPPKGNGPSKRKRKGPS